MSTAKLDITGDSKVAQREIDNLVKKVAGLKEQMRQMKEQSVKGSQESASALSGMIGQYVSAAAVAGVAMRAYGEWRMETDRLAQSHRDLSSSITKMLAESGELQKQPQVKEWLASLKGATAAQGTAALGGVMKSGETLSFQRSRDVAGEIAKLAPTGIDIEQAGGLAADIADIVGEGTSAGDVSDLTVGIKQMLRDKVGKFSGPKIQRQIQNLKESGMSGEDALAHAVAAFQHEEGGEALGALVTPGKKSREQRKMISDTFGDVAGIKEKLMQFKSTDAAAGMLAALPIEEQRRQAIAQGESANVEAFGGAASEMQDARTFIQQRSRRRGWVAQAAAFGNAQTSRLGEFFGADEQSRKQTGRGFAEEQVRAAANIGVISQDDAKEFIATLKKNTEAMQKNNDLMAAQNGRAGAKVNVDAHTE